MGIWKIIIKIIGTRITNKINQIWKIIMKIYKTIYIFIVYIYFNFLGKYIIKSKTINSHAWQLPMRIMSRITKMLSIDGCKDRPCLKILKFLHAFLIISYCLPFQ